MCGPSWPALIYLSVEPRHSSKFKERRTEIDKIWFPQDDHQHNHKGEGTDDPCCSRAAGEKGHACAITCR